MYYLISQLLVISTITPCCDPVLHKYPRNHQLDVMVRDWARVLLGVALVGYRQCGLMPGNSMEVCVPVLDCVLGVLAALISINRCLPCISLVQVCSSQTLLLEHKPTVFTACSMGLFTPSARVSTFCDLWTLSQSIVMEKLKVNYLLFQWSEKLGKITFIVLIVC